MATSCHLVLAIAVALCAVSATSAQKQVENARPNPGYSLEQISRNFRDSVAKAVEERLRKGNVAVEVTSMPRQQVLMPRRVPAVMQPSHPPPQHFTPMMVPLVKSAHPVAPTGQAFQHQPQIGQASGQYFMDTRNGQVFLDQNRHVPSGQTFQQQQHSGQAFQNQRSQQVFQEQPRNILPSGQVYNGQQQNVLVTEQVFGQKSEQVYQDQNQRQRFQEDARRTAPVAQVYNDQRTENVNYQEQPVAPSAVFDKQDRNGASFKTNQVFSERTQAQVPEQVFQEPIRPVEEPVVPTVRAQVAGAQIVPENTNQQIVERNQEFEANRQVTRPAQQVGRVNQVQANRGRPAPAPRKRVQPAKKETVVNEPVSQRFGVPVNSESDDEDYYNQAKEAHYSFSSAVQDGINDNHHTREEERDGLNLRGRYSYSDGFFKRTVHYEADDKGYRVVKMEVQPLGDGPRINPQGTAEVNTSLGGSYSITAQEIKDVREAEKEGQRLA